MMFLLKKSATKRLMGEYIEKIHLYSKLDYHQNVFF